MRDARIVMLSTGSPGLDYELNFEFKSPPTDAIKQALATAEFRLDVRGDTLLIRDGYQAEYWGERDYACVEVGLPSAVYNVVAAYLESEPHGQMKSSSSSLPTRVLCSRSAGSISTTSAGKGGHLDL